jgi:hypothetical protein
MSAVKRLLYAVAMDLEDGRMAGYVPAPAGIGDLWYPLAFSESWITP